MNITETFIANVDDNDLLKAPSRLQAVPFSGMMIIEADALVCNGSNNVKITVQLAAGNVPIEDVLLSANGYSTDNHVLHDDTENLYMVPIEERLIGGHILVSVDVTGTAGYFIRVSLTDE